MPREEGLLVLSSMKPLLEQHLNRENPAAQVMQQLPEEVLDFLSAELSFFDAVTEISGALYPVPKDERKAGAVRLAREVWRSTCMSVLLE